MMEMRVMELKPVMKFKGVLKVNALSVKMEGYVWPSIFKQCVNVLPTLQVIDVKTDVEMEFVLNTKNVMMPILTLVMDAMNNAK